MSADLLCDAAGSPDIHARSEQVSAGQLHCIQVRLILWAGPGVPAECCIRYGIDEVLPQWQFRHSFCSSKACVMSVSSHMVLKPRAECLSADILHIRAYGHEQTLELYIRSACKLQWRKRAHAAR